MPQMTPEMQQCIQNCLDCHATCLKMAMNHCLELGGQHTEPEHFKLMMDCVDICQTAANFMLRGSKHHPHICRECAEICKECADDCERIGDMDECVAACRKCAETCSAMAA